MNTTASLSSEETIADAVSQTEQTEFETCPADKAEYIVENFFKQIGLKALKQTDNQAEEAEMVASPLSMQFSKSIAGDVSKEMLDDKLVESLDTGIIKGITINEIKKFIEREIANSISYEFEKGSLSVNFSNVVDYLSDECGIDAEKLHESLKKSLEKQIAHSLETAISISVQHDQTEHQYWDVAFEGNVAKVVSVAKAMDKELPTTVVDETIQQERVEQKSPAFALSA